MRRLSVLTLSLSVPALVLVAPQFAIFPKPQPIPPRVEEVSLGDVSMTGGELDAQARIPSIATPQRSAEEFKLFAVVWDGSHDGVSVKVRLRELGSWSEWRTMEADDAYPDDGSAEGRRVARGQATGPLITPGADGYQVQVEIPGGVRVTNFKALLVDPGTAAADASVGTSPPGTAAAAPAAPAVIPRAAWGADESLRLGACPGGPSFSSTINVGFVHHTVDSNSYSAEDVAGILRSIYAFHVQGRGFCDIGCNFLIDRFGRIFEGRFGGIQNAVIGAHTGGFNTNSFGVSLIGTFTSVTPPVATQASLESVLAWKLGIYDRNPGGVATLTSGGGANSRFPAGQVVTFNVISGHRDAAFTECPGGGTYALLPGVRARVSGSVTNDPFVQALYVDMLGRGADPKERMDDRTRQRR